MINFIGAVAGSFAFGVILGSRIRRLPTIVYVILLVVVVASALMVGDYPFYLFTVESEPVPLNMVFVTSFLGLLSGSLLLGGGQK